MKSIQIQANQNPNNSSTSNNTILRASGVRRIRPGWYTVTFNGIKLDTSTALAATFNPKGKII